jgi:hypothetical protein
MADKIEHQDKGEPVTNCDRLVAVDNIETLIKVIRGQQVMLDKDLATLYGVETRTLNQAVKRNIQRFPADFRFQLTMEECSKSQIVTLNAGRGQNMGDVGWLTVSSYVFYCHRGSFSQPTGNPRAARSISGNLLNKLCILSSMSLLGEMMSRKYLMMHML